MTKRRRDDRGAAMVEFAIILPFLVMLTFGIIEFGRAYNTQISLQAAAREGARELALRHPANVVAAVQAADPTLTVASTVPCPTSGDGQAKVVVTKNFRARIPLIDTVLNINQNLTATGVMRCGL